LSQHQLRRRRRQIRARDDQRTAQQSADCHNV